MHKDWADYAFVLFSALLVVVGAVQVLWLRFTMREIRKSAEAANKSADVAQRQLEMAYRPWLALSVELVSDLTFDTNGNGTVVLRIEIRNTGPTPAVRIGCQMEWTVPDGPNPAIDTVYERLKREITEVTQRGRVLPPGGVIHIDYSASIDGEGIRREFERASSRQSGAHYMPTAIGCVCYQYTFADEWHYSGFSCNLLKWRTGGVQVAIEPMADTAKGKLSLFTTGLVPT